ncbi:hypothetical protein ACGFX4_19420 [Kitasatospora sp. NPDC048365]|uniref:hypothetical protein n=1 Tax=Kitasatospora sp. NPDC048365 TaxID=3364050 RepID=UPI003720E2B1
MTAWFPEPEYSHDARSVADRLASVLDAIAGAPHDILSGDQYAADDLRLGDLDRLTWPAPDGS